MATLSMWAVRRLFPGYISEIHSGLGNQLFQYAFGRTLADAAGVPYYICPKSTEPDYAGRICGLQSFSIRAKEIGPWVLSVFKDYSGWRGALLKQSGGIYTGINPWLIKEKEYDCTFSAADFTNSYPAPRLLSGYWQSETYFAHRAQTLKQDLTPKYPLPASHAHWPKTLGSRQAVSVHVRRGDYAYHPEIAAKFGTLPPSYYQDALSWVQARLPEAHFYVFSDEPVWAKANLVWPAQTTHMSTEDKSPAWIDLHLMSLCRHHILANSSFSWWGAWLGEHADSLIVAPSRWMAGQPKPPEGLVPVRWQLL